MTDAPCIGRKSRRLRLAVLLVGAAALACSPATRQKVGEGVVKAATEQPTWKQHPSTNKPRKNVVVQFSDASLHPSIARVLQGGNVAWVNYTMGFTGAVVFPEDFPDALTCGEPGPRFGKVARGYQSTAISGAAGEEVSLPCPLAPGEYEYELYLFEGVPGGPGAGMFDPNFTMQGKIVVE